MASCSTLLGNRRTRWEVDDDDDDVDDDDLNNLPRRKAFRKVSRKFPKNNLTISQQSNVASIDIPWCVMTCSWSALF